MRTRVGILSAALLAALALPALAAPPEHPSRTNGRIDPRELCAGAASQTLELNPRHPMILYSFENELADAAGVLESDSEEVMNRKIGRLIDASMPKLLCNQLNFNPANGNILKLAIARQSDPFIDDALDRWKVGLNQVDEVDGMTVLDYITMRKAEWGPGKGLYLDRYYKRFRAGGAKHRLELEQAGTIPPQAQVVASILARYETQARGGDFDSAMRLAGLFSDGRRGVYGQPFTNDPAKARYWAEQAGALALARQNAAGMNRVAAVHENLKDPASALSWYRRASALGSKEADFAVGRAYTWGLGTARNLDEALKYMTRAEAKGAATADMWMGYIYEQMGRRDMAIAWYRYAAQLGERLMPMPETMRPLHTWFTANGVTECGINAKGFDNCKR